MTSQCMVAFTSKVETYTYTHAHPIRHSTQRRAPHRQLFRDDAAGNRAPEGGRDILFHRRLSRADECARPESVARKFATGSARFLGLRPRSRAGCALSTIGRAASHRAGLDFIDRRADGTFGARAFLQRQTRPRFGADG